MITKRQKDLLDFIKSTIQDSGIPPSISDMARALRVKSKNAIAKLLAALEDEDLIRRDGTARGIRLRDEHGNEIQAGAVPVPVLGTITAGIPILAEQNIEEWVNLPSSLVRNRKDVFLLQVRGDSMAGAGILEGDLVIVKPTRDIKSGDIVVALLHDEATVKRFMQISNRRYLKPENPKYQNIYPEDEWTVQGKVVGVIRQLE